MKSLVRSVIAVTALALAATVSDTWAARRSGHGWQGGGARAGGFHHHHRVYGAFFFGAPFFYPGSPYYYPPPYYYGPDYAVPHSDLPGVYVERFEGVPAAETQGQIFCPDRGAYYPDVQDCPNGWQRVIRPPQATAPDK